MQATQNTNYIFNLSHHFFRTVLLIIYQPSRSAFELHISSVQLVIVLNFTVTSLYPVRKNLLISSQVPNVKFTKCLGWTKRNELFYPVDAV